MSIINFLQPEMGNFLVRIIAWLVKITSSVAVGVILFTLILKIITLPFDYFSRSSMRKNSIKMEKMRPELEKLQKQYAGNKDLYNRKMMALYKKNGYSMLGMCLPTIITLVIFIVAINAFTNYSKYQNLKYFYDMSVSYNNVVYSGFDLDNEHIKRDEKGVLIIDDKYFLDNGNVTLKNADGEDFSVTVSHDSENHNITVSTENGYVYYQRYYSVSTAENGETLYDFGRTVYGIIEGRISTSKLKSAENNFLQINFVKAEDGYDALDKGEDYAAAKEKNPELTEADFITEIRREKSAETFRNNGSKFLWVKNIWVTDSPMKHPVEQNWDTFVNTYSYDTKNGSQDMNADKYAELITELNAEQTEANGYFILVILTAGSSLLSQFIMSKSQKAQMELQTVDGQGAQQQKIMMWMMPIMMAIFAFMYTAAFSIYIVLSSFLSILTTLGINFIVDSSFKRAEAKAEKEVVRSKVRVIKEQPKEDLKNEKEEEQADFLSGLADKKSKKKK